jgi:multiple sugar transport system substrate-binding protein
MQESWIASVPNLDLQVFLDAVEYSFPVPNPPSGSEWETNVVEVLADVWSSGSIPDDYCARIEEAATAGLEA